MIIDDGLMDLLLRQQNAFRRDGIPDQATREDRLERAIQLLRHNRQSLCDAMNKDFHHRSQHQSLITDIYASIASLAYSQKNVSRWMGVQKRNTGLIPEMLGAKAYVQYQPKGVVGAISTWNFPVWTPFSSMGGIFAAGNRCMIKLSELTPETSLLISKLIGQYFDEEELVAINGDDKLAEAFSHLPFDHLIFTGSARVGKKVMSYASENLVPVTLELGGKSPVIIGKKTNLKRAAASLVSGKLLNAGQVCLSPDYLFVREDSLNELIAELERQVKLQFPSMLENMDYTSIINKQHHDRLTGYIQDAKNKDGEVWEINMSRENFSNQQGRFKMPLTLIINPSDDMLVMQEEIFGPILPMKSYRHIDEAIEYVNSRPRPLALYYYGDNREELEKVLSSTISGGVTVNDVIQHVGCEDLPFGGVGASGMGRYHGIEGFREFSNTRAVYSQSRINLMALGGLIPPYTARTMRTLKQMIDN